MHDTRLQRRLGSSTLRQLPSELQHKRGLPQRGKRSQDAEETGQQNLERTREGQGLMVNDGETHEHVTGSTATSSLVSAPDAAAFPSISAS